MDQKDVRRFPGKRTPPEKRRKDTEELMERARTQTTIYPTAISCSHKSSARLGKDYRTECSKLEFGAKI